MKRLLALLSFLFIAASVSAQDLPVGWEELTSPDFKKAVEKFGGVCIVPLGVIEKHGPQLPLGTDVYTAREISYQAAQKEYSIVYPYYFVGQIFEAKHQPGIIAYSTELIYKMLEETCAEIARNGIKKIILVNSHGGNNAFLQYFCQSQLDKEKDYVVYLFRNEIDPETRKQITDMRKSTLSGHADEVETSLVMTVRPDLVKVEHSNDELGVDMNRLSLGNTFTGIWWYAKYPNHYSGDAKDANEALGKVSMGQRIESLVNVIRIIKADNTAIELQNQFFKESSQPLKTTIK